MAVTLRPESNFRRNVRSIDQITGGLSTQGRSNQGLPACGVAVVNAGDDVNRRYHFPHEASTAAFPQPGSNKTMILVHGISYTRMGMVKYMPIFRRLGWNILIYDQRFFGRSGGSNTSFGYYEKRDLVAAFDWAKNKAQA